MLIGWWVGVGGGGLGGGVVVVVYPHGHVQDVMP